MAWSLAEGRGKSLGRRPWKKSSACHTLQMQSLEWRQPPAWGPNWNWKLSSATHPRFKGKIAKWVPWYSGLWLQKLLMPDFKAGSSSPHYDQDSHSAPHLSMQLFIMASQHKSLFWRLIRCKKPIQEHVILYYNIGFLKTTACLSILQTVSRKAREFPEQNLYTRTAGLGGNRCSGGTPGFR